MNMWRRQVAGVTAASFMFVGCATILSGSVPKEDRSDDIKWGYVVADVLLTGVVGIIIDFATGAIFEKKSGSHADVYHQLEVHAKRGEPCYVAKADGVYRAEVLGEQITLVRVPDSEVPGFVLSMVEAEGYRPVLAMAR